MVSNITNLGFAHFGKCLLGVSLGLSTQNPEPGTHPWAPVPAGENEAKSPTQQRNV